MTYVVSALVVVTLIQGWLLWRLIRIMSVLSTVDDRLSRCAQGLSLLVDTSEAGFAMLGGELTKLTADAAPRPAGKATTRRIVNAAKRGRTVPAIAAQEGLSEGEVRLRMHLADAVPRAAADRTRDHRHAVRP